MFINHIENAHLPLLHPRNRCWHCVEVLEFQFWSSCPTAEQGQPFSNPVKKFKKIVHELLIYMFHKK